MMIDLAPLTNAIAWLEEIPPRYHAGEDAEIVAGIPEFLSEAVFLRDALRNCA